MISFNTSQSKDELFELATAQGLELDTEMKKTEIINAIKDYNATLESEEEKDSDLSESDKNPPVDTEEKDDLSESDENTSVDSEEKDDLSESDKNPPVDTEEQGEHGTYVYVGPSLPNGILTSKATFIGTRAEVERYLGQVIKTYPKVKKLLVPYEKTASMSVRAKTRGNSTYNDFLAVSSAVAENRKKNKR